MNTNSTIDHIIINPKHPANSCIIWLHGLGADGNDLVDVATQLKLTDGTFARFIFPHAPIRPITRAAGMSLRAWFDIADSLEKQDESGIRSSQVVISDLIRQQIAAGIPSNRIVVAGFSQGGALALQCGLRYSKTLGGILSLSGFLPLAKTLKSERHAANQNIPILLMHGKLDPVVPLAMVVADCRFLSKLGCSVALNTYPALEHGICQDEIEAISSWLQPIFMPAA